MTKSQKFLPALFVYLSMTLLLPSSLCADSGEGPSDSETPTKSQELDPWTEQARARLIELEPVQRPHSWWYQLQVGGSIYDARREALVERWSPGLSVGRRFSRSGVFLLLEVDQTIDLTQEIKRLDIVHIGMGVEFLQFLGRVRSSLAVGASLLRSSTDIDPLGKTGWFIDLRPASLRWPWGRKGAFEFTPLSMDLTVPVTKGIPLILFSYFTVVSFEWAEGDSP